MDTRFVGTRVIRGIQEENLPHCCHWSFARNRQVNAREDWIPHAHSSAARIRILGCGTLLNVVYRITDSSDLLGVLVLDLKVELLLHRHYDLNEIQRVGIQVANELGFRDNLFGVDAKTIGDDILNTLKSCSQDRPSSFENCSPWVPQDEEKPAFTMVQLFPRYTREMPPIRAAQVLPNTRSIPGRFYMNHTVRGRQWKA
jgi:hypothetical protein